MPIKSMKERPTPGYELEVGGGQTDAAALAIAASQPIPPSADPQYHDQAQFESDKRAVYKHPLFPLLALLFEKCEIATQTAPDTPMSDSFHHDLEAFVQHQERDRKPFLANDPEVDGLMIKAIQVLRIHLLELDKVQELCKDFCNRYITCLKGKMQSENLLRSDYYDNVGSNGVSLLIPSSHSNSPHHSSFSSSNGGGGGRDQASVSPSLTSNNNNNSSSSGVFHHHHHPHHNSHNSSSHQPHPHHQQSGIFEPHPHVGVSPIPLPSSVGSLSLLNHPSPDHSTNSSSHHSSPATLSLGIHGGTPLSQIGANNATCPTTSSSHESFVPSGFCSPTTPSSVEDDDDYLGRKKPKRGVLPKQATSIMRSWLFQHIVHPYPTEDEKRQIAAQTNLTLLQVNNWFINARRRILQPMLDASNPEPATPKVKKMKTNGSKPALKYWADNLATIGPTGQLDGSDGGNGVGIHGDDTSEESDESSNDDNDDTNDLLIDNSDSSQP